MQSPLDQAITATSAAEANYTADQQNVENIQTAITTATQPLAAAQSQLSTDQTAYIAALNALSQAALDEAATLAPPPPPAA
jgi:hypothetical protein